MKWQNRVISLFLEGLHSQLEWDDIVPLACAAYNFLPNEHSRESPFFLMFGRDPLLPFTKLLKPKIRYLGNDEYSVFGGSEEYVSIGSYKLEICQRKEAT